eukprot:15706_1
MSDRIVMRREEAHMTSLLNIRRRVASIRDTVCRDIEGELVMEAEPDWPDTMAAISSVSRQLSNLVEEIDPVFQYFAFQPVRSTAVPSHLSLFLSTRPLTEMETGGIGAGNDVSRSLSMEDEQTNSCSSFEDMNEIVQIHNSTVASLEGAFQSAISGLLEPGSDDSH